MESGARAAIRGYQRQALYTANLLIQEDRESRVFQPEGREDLAVYFRDTLEQAVQVKAYSAPLSLSDLKPQKPGSFFRRILTLEDTATVELASFGPLGSELLGVQNGDKQTLARVADKLRGHGFTALEAEKVLSRLSIVSVDKQTIQEEVFNFLAKTVTAGAPERAFDLLVWWLLEASERRLRITVQQFRDRLQAVGRYLAERQAHHQEWFSTIKPLESQTDPRGLPSTKLEEEYYQGAAARYSHIRAGLDVRRDALLQAIDTEFQHGKKVVILHGASGQGKTSLALRYLHEYVPDGWRFLVTAIDSRKHAARIANAFADHLYALTFPLYLLIDVAPRDFDWVALVREVLDFEQIRILVAIREEDLARQTSAPHELGFPADIRLEFGPAEAEPIYETLAQRAEVPNVFPTFKEAWERFGGEGPLLEFVYLLTQTQSLRSVLTAQVHRLREEVRAGTLEPHTLRLLHLCAVATAFEARVLLRPLGKHLELADPGGTVRLLEREYLLRIAAEGTAVEALHSFRSALLAEIMADPIFSPPAGMILEVQPFIPEEDLEIFLLYAFSRQPNCSEQLFDELKNRQLSTWSAAAGVGRALMWRGIKSYLEKNEEVLAEYSSLPGGSDGLMLILPDLAGALETDPLRGLLELLADKNPPVAEKLRILREELTPRQRAFAPLGAWLNGLEVEAGPVSTQDWESLGELIFWAGHLGIQPPSSLKLADVPVESLPIETVAKICLALAKADPEGYAAALTDQEERLRTRFQEQTLTPLLADDDENITAHFIVRLNAILSKPSLNIEQVVGPRHSGGWESSQQSPTPEVGDGGLANKLNQEAVSRASLLRSLFPNRSHFCSQGYGHQLGIEGLELPNYITHKAMPASALPASWLVQVNSIANSLWIHQRRPESWRQYAEIVLKRREIAATALLKLKRSLSVYFEGDKPRSLLSGPLPEKLWQEAKAATDDIPRLPVSAVDEWGLSSETSRSETDQQERLSASVATVASMLAQRPLSSALQDYFSGLGNFFKQGSLICAVHGFFGRQPEKRVEFQEIVDKAGYDDHQVRLSKFNLFSAMQHLQEMQDTFDERVGSLVNTTKLDQIKRRESQLFPELWALWYQFCDHPEKRLLSAGTQAVSAFEDARSDLLNALQDAIPTGEGWHAIVLRADFSWEGKRALGLQLEVASIDLLEEAKRELFAVLEETFGGLDAASLFAYALEYYLGYVLVTPTTGRQVLGSGTWVLPCASFSRIFEGRLVDRGWLKILHPLNSKQIRELGLEKGEIGGVSRLDEFLEISAQLQLAFAHLVSFRDLAPKLDAHGQQILSGYFTELAPWVNELLSKFEGLVPEVCEALRQSSLVEQDACEGAVSALERTGVALEEFSDENRTMNFEDYERWAEEFEEVANIVRAISWLSLEGDH